MRGQGEGKKLRDAARLLARGALISEQDEEHDEAANQNYQAALRDFCIVEITPDDEDPDEADVEPETFYLLPEAVPVWNLWQHVQTQWRHSEGIPTGLDYASVVARMGRVGRRRQKALLDGIAQMEDSWLDEKRKMRERQPRRRPDHT